MSKISKIRKLIVKTLVVFVVLVNFLFIFNYPVKAQDTGKCGGINGFVNWKDCLYDTTGKADPYNPTDFFINSGYTKFYQEKVNGFVNFCSGSAAFCAPGISAREFALNSTTAKVISDIVSLILCAMIGVFLFLVFKAVFIYITAGDNDDTIQKSKKTFSTAAKGLLIVAIGFIVIGLVGSLLGLGNFWEIKLFT